MPKKNAVVVRRSVRPPLERYLSVGEAAEMLGVSPRHLREQINTGRVPAYRLGPRSTRIKLSDIEAILEPVVSDQ